MDRIFQVDKINFIEEEIGLKVTIQKIKIEHYIVIKVLL